MFELPQNIKNDLGQYKDSLRKLLSGELTPVQFKGVRVLWGIYPHRGDGLFMVRVRLPAGRISAQQLKALAHISRKYGNAILHLTTRQDIQVHAVKIEDTAKAMEYLLDYGVSSRGGGGDAVRNIVACPLSGICENDLTDIARYAVSISEYLLKEKDSFELPRKFKIAFSGCAQDCAGCLVNDLGFLAVNKQGENGFQVFAGGGMGALSRLGEPLEEFIPVAELVYCIEAVKNIFYKKGNRENRKHNRLRFLVEELGFAEFKKLYKEEYSRLKEEGVVSLREIVSPVREETGSALPQIEDKEFKEFLSYNVRPQKQNGFVSVELRIPQGDLPAKQAEELARLSEEFRGIEFRLSLNQNIFICWVKNEELHRLFLKIKQMLGGFLYPATLLDIVPCKGALTCGLGFCDAPGMAQEIELALGEKFIGKKIFRNLNIRISGCPNACSQHPIGGISFYGVTRKAGGQEAPYYKLLLGGRKKAGESVLAEGIGIIAGEDIPAFLKEFLAQLEAEIAAKDEDIFVLLNGPGKEIARRVLTKYFHP